MYASDPAPLSSDASLLRTRSAARTTSAAARIGKVGDTPLLPLETIGHPLAVGTTIWGKAEFMNPTGSVKDRAAWYIVQAAITSGAFEKGRRLLDASSGNTGVAYAMLGARLGFGVTICLPRSASHDREARLRAYGAEVVATDPLEGTEGAQLQARQMYADDPGRYFYADQYNNIANPNAHYATTGPEIWGQTQGRVTHLVAGVGTGGTISGTGRYLKERNATIRVIGVEPDGPLHGIEGLKHLPSTGSPGTYSAALVDETRRLATEQAQEWTRRLAREEGLLVGTSAGAAVAVACLVGRETPGATVVAILPDRGERDHPTPRGTA